jgi:hypothetical protein
LPLVEKAPGQNKQESPEPAKSTKACAHSTYPPRQLKPDFNIKNQELNSCQIKTYAKWGTWLIFVKETALVSSAFFLV